MINHWFPVHVAVKYGQNCAILLSNIQYFVEKNKANNINYYDGKYWTYNTNKSFVKFFPYLTSKQIRTALDKLLDEGLILTANYGKGCDRTLWYTITEKAERILNGLSEETDINNNEEDNISISGQTIDVQDNAESNENIVEESTATQDDFNSDESVPFAPGGKCNCPVGQMDLPCRADVINTTINTHINTNKLKKETHKEKKSNSHNVCEEIFNFWNSKQLLECSKLTNDIQLAILSALKKYSVEQIKLAIDRYDMIYNDKTYWASVVWTLYRFIKLSKAMPEYMDGGTKWEEYRHRKQKQVCDSQSENDKFIHNSYTKEQISSLISDLDTVDV